MAGYIGLSTLEVLEDARNYNKWIAESIKPYIKTPVVEIGAGTGNLTSLIAVKTALLATDADAELVSRLRNKFNKNYKVSVDKLNIEKRISLKYKSVFNTVFAINVLEHIFDDQKALSNTNQLLTKNGRLILLIPAKRFAFTRLDKELGHYRRYEKDDIIKKLEKANFVVRDIYFFNFVGLLSWYFRDKLKQKNIKIKKYQVKIFDKIVPLLRSFESKIKIPMGISLIVVSEKK